ncbi:MAG TPA: hypothetical protein PK718_08930 [Candidatus Methanofastidiosa archaeon]|nr:hypothetical protein [Candidatus Methanofastidiosa archaeon]HPR42647.1 hypothetical protein [Candidatus Methanofastidiosa archaeon]
MSNPIGVLIIALIIGFAIGSFIRGEYFNKKTYATTLALGVFIDMFLGNFPFYNWDITMEIPFSLVFISSLLGLYIGKFIGGR